MEDWVPLNSNQAQERREWLGSKPLVDNHISLTIDTVLHGTEIVESKKYLSTVGQKQLKGTEYNT